LTATEKVTGISAKKQRVYMEWIRGKGGKRKGKGDRWDENVDRERDRPPKF